MNQTIIIIGEAHGTYTNTEISKEFSGKLLATARPDSSLIVHNLTVGVRPICYLENADVSVDRNIADAPAKLTATTEDGQQLTITFTKVIAIEGVPEEEKQNDSLALNILKCVHNLKGQSRITVARLVSKALPDTPIKDVTTLIDWLIEEFYIAYANDAQNPPLLVTSRGLDILIGADELPVEG